MGKKHRKKVHLRSPGLSRPIGMIDAIVAALPQAVAQHAPLLPTAVASGIKRFSSRLDRLDRIFLADRLQGALSYTRIAGYFRSSIFELVGEEIAKIPSVRIVCNSELDARDLMVSKEVQKAKLKEKFNELEPEADALLHRDRYRRLHTLLTKGNVQVRVVPKDLVFLHGKAGVIEAADGSKSCFLGSINESRSAFAENYEILWEDRSAEGVTWVEAEFEALWADAIPLPDVIIEEIERLANRVELAFEDCPSEILAEAAFVESPLYRGGDQLQPWQRSFVVAFQEHIQRYGCARLLIADEVGVGKTLSLAASAIVSALQGDGPVLILCPATLTLQWQVELFDRLGVPSAVWSSSNKTWTDHQGHVIRTRGEEDILKCPYRIAIVSTGLIFHASKESELLLKARYGTVVLDEAHKARRKRELGKEDAEPNNLLAFMQEIAPRTKNLLLGTATPIQTETEELFDLVDVLNRGVEFVLGRSSITRWNDTDQVTQIITGKQELLDPKDAWDWIRCPLPHRQEHRLFAEIRSALDIPDGQFICQTPWSDLPLDIRRAIEDELEGSGARHSLSFFQTQNPIIRHTILRQRRELEKMGLLTPIQVDVHPDPERLAAAYPGLIFEAELGLPTNHFFDVAYQAFEAFVNELTLRMRGASLLRSLLLQRVCSSFASARCTAEKMLAKRTIDDDEELDEETLSSLAVLTPEERTHLELVLSELSRPDSVDPKLKAIKYFLMEHRIQGKTWLDLGCIIFSQYYDTVSWVADELSKALPNEPVCVYAGAGRSRIYRNGEFVSVEREAIKKGVRDRLYRLVVATDAACEGLNLQTLGTLINIDLPWNPSKLEQRLGRIKRFGQGRASVDMLNLVYHNTRDEKVYATLSRRMKDRYDIFGSLPDTIDDEWIADIASLDRELKKYTSRKEKAQNAFQLRYNGTLDPDANRWDLCQKVLSRGDFMKVMSEAW